MSIDSVQTLSPDVLAQLRRHNLLQAFLRAEILSTAVGGVALSEDQRESVWKQFKIQHKLDNPALIDAHLNKIGLSEMDVRWQLELPKRVQLHSQEHFNHKAEARSRRHS